MRRWNGWGEAEVEVPLSDGALRLLRARLGEGTTDEDASLDTVLSLVPASDLSHAALSVSPGDRLDHSHGQSLPDWIRLRSGRIGRLPDAVAFPSSPEQITQTLDWARNASARVVPFGGGTSVVGHLEPPPGEQPVIALAMSRMNRLLTLDETSHLARFEAGVTGPDLEAQLSARGYRLGHYPQSFEYSTLGGWIATRSSGQESYGYGRIEALVAGLKVHGIEDTLDLPALPASAAGPDLKHWILGSEGRLGIIGEATVRVRRVPEYEAYHAVLFKDWESGVDALRQLAQERAPLSMLRLSDRDETEHFSAQTPARGAAWWAERGLARLGYAEQRCLLVLGVNGTELRARAALADAILCTRRHGGLPLGSGPGHSWQKNRFRGAYLRNSLWDAGYAVDTFETATRWSEIGEVAASVKKATEQAFAVHDERVISFSHLSHVYPDGASLYTTCLFRRAADPDELLARWRSFKAAVSEAIVRCGATISHQHGVGVDHAAYLEAEKSAAGLELLDATLRARDPGAVLNPGKLRPR